MTNHKDKATVRVIGGGLAGSEASYQLAKRGISVRLYEMKPHKKSPAHKSDAFAELVCSNSLRSDDITSAIGLLHEEMRKLDSLILKAADATKVPAGGALAVDREAFAKIITETLTNHPNITIYKEEIQEIPDDDLPTIIATGPLTTDSLAISIQKIIGSRSLYFFDALAPIIHTDSIDMSKAWWQSRYDKGGGSDYINCPMSKEEYEAFVHALITAEKIAFKDFEKNTPYFEGCLPIEVMAERGVQTLSYGPMKPVGLKNPHKTEQPYAVVQLRQDNQAGTLVNMVGFQTKLTHGEQVRIFRTIKGLENAQFARLGGIHRNTFINSPEVLDATLRLKTKPNIRFAGQITGCEGYTESASIGLLAGLFLASELKQKDCNIPPKETAIGALLAHITNPLHSQTFQPMNINFGLIQTPKEEGVKHKKGLNKKEYASMVALEAINAYILTLNSNQAL